MGIRFHRRFVKAYNSLSNKQQEAFDKRYKIFSTDPFDPMLRNHTLKGKYENCRSINITGDMCAVYTIRGGVVVFLTLGTHAELYG